MINYQTIKDLAAEIRQQGQRCQITDLIALSDQNDPFYVGRPAELDKAQWFADLWERFGYTDGVHLRRIHYRIVSQDSLPILPNGKVYENTENCWKYLNDASKYARYLKLVDPAAFEDRRNPEAIINAHWPKRGDWTYSDPAPFYDVSGTGDPWASSSYSLPGLPRLAALPHQLPYLPGFVVAGYENLQQPYLIEIWAEKTTQNDILEPLCRRYDVNLITGAGELSITAVIHFLDRVREAERPARILYVSDFDPAGLGMPISVARKVEYFQREEGHDDLDIRLEPVILTAEQVAVYDLPRTPIKDSDLRKKTWEELHGRGATELDALEALRPGEMARIIDAAILGYYDPTLNERAAETRAELTAALSDRRDEALEEYQEELGDIRADYRELQTEFDQTRRRFDELIADFQEEIDTHGDKLTDIKERFEEVYGKLYDDLADVEIDAEEEYPLPEPDLPAEADSLLYDSRRDYLTQLQYYKAMRNGQEA